MEFNNGSKTFRGAKSYLTELSSVCESKRESSRVDIWSKYVVGVNL